MLVMVVVCIYGLGARASYDNRATCYALNTRVPAEATYSCRICMLSTSYMHTVDDFRVQWKNTVAIFNCKSTPQND